MLPEGGDGMTTSAEPRDEIPAYEVGVAVVPLGQGVVISPDPRQERVASVPGYEDLRGTGRRAILIEKGEKAVNAATEALASQIATSAERIARVISEKISSTPRAGYVDLESVDVSFGVTLTVGLQAIFTSQAESSAQVTITLRCRAGTPSSTPVGSSE
jgi:hypothetical protein